MSRRSNRRRVYPYGDGGDPVVSGPFGDRLCVEHGGRRSHPSPHRVRQWRLEPEHRRPRQRGAAHRASTRYRPQPLGPKVANNFQFSAGALADPLQLASRSQFSVRDSVSVVTGRGSLNVSVSHDRLSPSLVARLREQLNLLAPGLRSSWTIRWASSDHRRCRRRCERSSHRSSPSTRNS